MMLERRNFIFAVVIALCSMSAAHAQLRGHGGPVRALAVSSDGEHAISGSFDTSVIRWSLKSHTAEEVLRFHEGAVNAVAFLEDGRIATSGEDARIALWRPGEGKPMRLLEGHRAPIAGLAVAPDGSMLASASWDHTARVWSLTSDEKRSFEGHHQNVNGVAFSADGRALASAGYDATLRIWPLKGSEPPIVVPLPAPLNTVAAAPDGEIIAAGADGRLYFLSPSGERTGELDTGGLPIISVVLSGDGKLIAAAGIRGSIAIIDRQLRVLQRTLVGPGFPVWSAAFLPDNRTLLTGGTDRLIRRWDASTGWHLGGVAVGAPDDPLAAYAGDRGAEVFRACVACHTLSSDQSNRAGPTLAGIFGRKIATLPGYNFSEPLKKLEIVWTPDTLSKLFELGPAAYTPGTKMPEQRIGAPEDRAALIRFLKAATKKR
jgi:cytochrome c